MDVTLFNFRLVKPRKSQGENFGRNMMIVMANMEAVKSQVFVKATIKYVFIKL